MKAADILTATHQLEDTGMTRSQSEIIANTIIAAVEPLATREDLEAVKADIAALREDTKADFAAFREETQAGFAALREETKADFAALREETKANIAALREETQASFAAFREEAQASFADLREDNKASIAALKADSKANLEFLTEHLATKKEVESTKNYLLTGLLALYGILLAAAVGSALI